MIGILRNIPQVVIILMVGLLKIEMNTLILDFYTWFNRKSNYSG
jgi:hypothetical protein